MVFSSLLFLFRFLPIFFILYYVAPGRMKNLILFLGSLIFYAWGEPVYILLMFFSVISDYLHGIAIENAKLTGKKRLAEVLLISSVIINLALLGFFKYSGFLVETVNQLLGTAFVEPDLPLPIGISFYTFQTMSYSIDVYRGKTKAQRNILDFGTYVVMFPQLIAGPIVQYKTVETELTDRILSLKEIKAGLVRFLIGLGKKVLLANQAGLVWNTLFLTTTDDLSVLGAWVGIVFYGFQIYFDFSGYSDMAIGLGQMMGFHFPENFNYPYISRSITEFWRRWHMTLSGWFREYVYIPLGGNRKGLKRQLINILIVWALTGIWHGAAWNFLLWGLWFGLLLMAEKLGLLKLLEKVPKAVGHIYAMAAVLFGWVLFAIEDFEKMTGYLSVFLGTKKVFMNNAVLYELSSNWLFLIILILGCTPIPAYTAGRLKEKCCELKREYVFIGLETFFLLLVFVLSAAFLVDASYNPFLYFRF